MKELSRPHTRVHSPWKPLPSRLPHNTEQSSLCSTVAPCELSVLNASVCTGHISLSLDVCLHPQYFQDTKHIHHLQSFLCSFMMSVCVRVCVCTCVCMRACMCVRVVRALDKRCDFETHSTESLTMGTAAITDFQNSLIL